MQNNRPFCSRFGSTPGGHDAIPLRSLVGMMGLGTEDKVRMKWGLNNLDKLGHPFAGRVRGILEPLLREGEASHSTVVAVRIELLSLADDLHDSILDTLNNSGIADEEDQQRTLEKAA